MTEQPLPYIWLIVLIVLNGITVAIQNAYLNSHPTTLRQLEEAGERGASLAARIAHDSTNLILSVKASHSIIRLIILGMVLIEVGAPFFLSESTAEAWLLLLGTGTLVGMVEMAAEGIVLRAPERSALWLAPFAAVIRAIFLPAGRISFRFSSMIAGTEKNHTYSLVTEEEIMTMVDAGEEGGVIEEDEKAMIYSIFRLANTLVREVMVPRIDILAFDENTTLQKATEMFLKTGYSRAPVYRDSIDNIIGLVYSKDLLAVWEKSMQLQTVGELLREAYFVPEAKKADDLLTELQAKRIHMAVVVDEYGGTAGVVTMEDIVEEIVGEIRDEYDDAEETPFQMIAQDEFIFTGGIDLDDVNQLTGANLPKDTSETLGGFIYGRLGKVPVSGETVEAGGLQLTVEQITGRRIRKIRAKIVEKVEEEMNTNGN
ncbi:MAG: HlyC/CorC family transporter [Anaerolineales bacterium]|nr:HlyC/CorC family transporter [Anaerolineales bacterium]